jgi:hypothetical protein
MDFHKKSVEGVAALTLQCTSDNSLSQLNELTLHEFLDTYKSIDTFNLLGLKGGKWLIPKCNYKVFYNLLAKAIQTNKRKLHYVEYPLKCSNKVIIDADFDQTTNKRLYTKDTIYSLLKLYETEIQKHIKQEVVFIVSERDKPYKKSDGYKDGFHAIAPHIRLPTGILENIRTNVLEQIGNLFANDNDPIKEWLSKNYTITKNSDDKIATGELYSQFKDDNITTNISNRNFGKLIKFNKIGLKKSNGKRYYTNIVAKEDKYNI